MLACTIALCVTLASSFQCSAPRRRTTVVRRYTPTPVDPSVIAQQLAVIGVSGRGLRMVDADSTCKTPRGVAVEAVW